VNVVTGLLDGLIYLWGLGNFEGLSLETGVLSGDVGLVYWYLAFRFKVGKITFIPQAGFAYSFSKMLISSVFVLILIISASE